MISAGFPDALCAGEFDPVSLMATFAREVHHTLPQAHWTGFYRVVAPGILKSVPTRVVTGAWRFPLTGEFAALQHARGKPSGWTMYTSFQGTSPALQALNRNSCRR